MPAHPESLSFAIICSSALVAYLAGWLWYSPRIWGPVLANGDTAQRKIPWLSMGVQGLAILSLAGLIALIVQRQSYATLLIVLAGFMFVQCISGVFNQKNRQAIVMEAGYSLLMFLLMLGVQLWAS